MDHAELAERIGEALENCPGVGAAFLGGSHGRGEADAYSDIDVYAVVADSEEMTDVVTRLARTAEAVAPLVFSKVLPNARTINCITLEWHRFDLTVVTGSELAFLTDGQARPLFDQLGLTAALAAVAPSSAPPAPEALLDIVSEFIRVLGLSVVAKGREDLVVAQTGTNLLRDMLIKTMVLANGARPRRGALALRKDLTPDQVAALLALPSGATWPAVLERTQAIAGQFFPRARALAEEVGADWPEDFERVTRAHVQQNIGIDLP
jgi:predicted nucleotidyltransferase